MEKETMKTVLFVCTANQCRSPMAEGMFRKMLADKGKADVRVESAGISRTDTSPATDEAVKAMRRRGIDIRQHASRHVTKRIADGASLILVMTKNHREMLAQLYPDCQQKTFMLSEYAEGKELDVPDPVGLDIEAYGIVAALLERFLRQVAEKV